MEKKEYQSPKMEVIEMPAYGNLLASSDTKNSLRVFINSESCSNCDDDDY